jgi:hypothetical protein
VWSGDAVVHVSIVDWIKGEQPGVKKLFRQLEDNLDSVGTPAANTEFCLPAEQTERLAHRYIRTEHPILGLLREENLSAARFLKRARVSAANFVLTC